MNKNEMLSEDVNSVISVQECSKKNEIWLKRPFEWPTTTTTTTTTTISITTLLNKETGKTSKYILILSANYLKIVF